MRCLYFSFVLCRVSMPRYFYLRIAIIGQILLRHSTKHLKNSSKMTINLLYLTMPVIVEWNNKSMLCVAGMV